MKTTYIFIFQIILITNVFTQHASIYGKITNPADSMVYISYYKDLISYERVFADSAKLNANGEFYMHFRWNSAFPVEFRHGKERTNMFLSKNDSLKIDLNAQSFDNSLSYSGRGAIVNNYMAQKIIKFPERSNSNIFQLKETEFTHHVDSAFSKKIKFYKNYFLKYQSKKPLLKPFMDYEEAEISYDCLYSKLSYPGLYAYYNKQKEALTVSKKYYNFLQNVSIINPNTINSISYLIFVETYIDGEIKKIHNQDTSKSLLAIKEQFINKNLSGEIKSYILAKWTYSLLVRKSDLINGKRIFENYKSNSKNQRYTEVLEKAYQNAARLAIGKPAPNFSFPDINGQMVSLSDFKGKVVYLDIWASWCGPCIMQIPHAKKLAASLKDKDIVFLYVSIDDNKDAWKKMIADKELEGIQLISNGDFESNISILYQVKSIPRYFIIDKQGLIANNNPERPSGNVHFELETLLMKD